MSHVDSSVKSKHFIVALGGAETYLCREHDLSLDYYCTLCKDAICMDCFLTKHNSHPTKTMVAAKIGAINEFSNLKSLHAENNAIRKSVEEEAQKVFENIENNEREVLEKLQRQQLKMQHFISLLFGRASESYRRVFAERKESLLQEATKSTTADPCIDSLIALMDIPNRHDLRIVTNISNLEAALMQCQQETKDIQDSLLFLKGNQTFHEGISLKIYHREIFKSMVKLFSNVALDPPSAGKFHPVGITFETYNMDDSQCHNTTKDSKIYSKGGDTLKRTQPGKHALQMSC